MSSESEKYTQEEAINEALEIKGVIRDARTSIDKDKTSKDEYESADRYIDLKNKLDDVQLEELNTIRSHLRFGLGGTGIEMLESSTLPKELIDMVIGEEISHTIKVVGRVIAEQINKYITDGILSKEQAEQSIIEGTTAFLRAYGNPLTYARFIEDSRPWVGLLSCPEYRAVAQDVIIRVLNPPASLSSVIWVSDITRYMQPLGVVEEAKTVPAVREAAIAAYAKTFHESISRGSDMSGRHSDAHDGIRSLFNLTEEELFDVQIGEITRWLELRNTHWALSAQEECGLTNQQLLDSEAFIQSSRQMLVKILDEEKGNRSEVQSVYDAIEFADHFEFDQEFLVDEELQTAARGSFIRHMVAGGGEIGTADHIADAFEIPETFLTSSEAREAAIKGIKILLKSKSNSDIREYYPRAIELVKLSPEEFDSTIKETLADIMEESDGINKAREFAGKLNVSDEKFLEMAQSIMVESLKDSNLGLAIRIVEGVDIPEELIRGEEIRTLAIGAFSGYLEKRSIHISVLRELVEKFHLPEDVESYNQNLLFGVTEKIKLDKISDVLSLLSEYQTYVWYLTDEKKKWIFNSKELNLIKEKFLEPKEIHLLKENGFNLAAKWTETNDSGKDGWKQAFEILSQTKERRLHEWEDEENITGPFRRGAEIFGYERMFYYMTHSNGGRHDALYAFDSIVNNLYQPSGLEANVFYSCILQQVLDDTSHQYPERSSVRWLNNIAQNTSPEQIQKTLQDLSTFVEIPKLRELAQHINSFDDVFSSWSNLKRFYAIQKLIEKRELLEKLAELKNQGRDRLYNYIETLAFHETSDVSMEKVMQFWQDPERFLSVGDEHSGRRHNMKKPSNYVNIPNLDLTAEELRDSLVEGDLDSLQVFHPFEIVYDVPIETNGGEPLPILELLKKALGSRKNNIPGLAINPTKLFSGVGKMFKAQGINLQAYISGEIQISSEQEDILFDLINDPNFGVKKSAVKTDKYRAKIYLKSDPEGVVAGNDTACCMPFGSGKNNVYTYNPVCSIFTIQRQTADGRWRTIAQSVLTEDRDIKTNISDLTQTVENAETPEIATLIPDEILTSAKSTITADNVEVAPNFRSREGASELLENLYRDFFNEYLSRYNVDGRFDDQRIIVGEGYSDALNTLPKVDNTFLPYAPVAYSDNIYPTAYSLPLHKAEPFGVAKAVTETEQPPNETENIEALKAVGIAGLSYLDFRDTLPVAFLEGKAYADNPSLLTYLHNLENGLIAKDITNSSKKRLNMSLKWQDTEGRIRGYILAYEGKKQDEKDELEDYDEYDNDENEDMHPQVSDNGERILYISDLASDKASAFAGGRLIKAFFALYKINYLDKGDPIPIFFEGREQTSYAIIKRQLDRISKDLGARLEMDEGETHKEGGDIMHPVTLRVKGAA
ncbi:hypothetical protein A2215_02925 [Candidatus Berkelbacteria bacterium RIFOXYA2_FULL_43_10]|uniref:Uncharacterized protein n=1 Tax=Candidatus Berkelbacteria bacterium RIFOXYA2_FULL_43_10 TaxID=1797472 RepID=A0A1F5E4M8_9BACT|nr:MAG: hypothetical protein A2215_02925 [Candidatus Berkelbacteria bacterium RIFOXYA2_FULL_43_10]